MVFALSTCVGEFGVVYRAKLLRKQGKSEPGFVAVKTMRGMTMFELRDMHTWPDSEIYYSKHCFHFKTYRNKFL